MVHVETSEMNSLRRSQLNASQAIPSMQRGIGIVLPRIR